MSVALSAHYYSPTTNRPIRERFAHANYVHAMGLCAPVVFLATVLDAYANPRTIPRPWIVAAVNGLFLTLHWPVGIVVALSMLRHRLAHRQPPTQRRPADADRSLPVA